MTLTDPTESRIRIKERRLGRFMTGQSIDQDQDITRQQINSISHPFLDEKMTFKILSLRKLRKSDKNPQITQKEIELGIEISQNELESNMLGRSHQLLFGPIYLEDYQELDHRQMGTANHELDATTFERVEPSQLDSETLRNFSKVSEEESVQMNMVDDVLANANSGSIEQLNQLISSKNREIQEGQVKAFQLINDFFSRFKITESKKKNCIFFQEMMKSMPSQEKKWTKKIKDFFSRRSITNLKSYRTLAIEMLLSFETSESKRLFIDSQIDKYRKAKALYYQEFMTDHVADYEAERARISEMRAQVDETDAELTQTLLRQQELQSTFDTMRLELKRLANILEGNDFKELQREKLAYRQMAQEVREATEDIDYSKFQEHFSEKSTVKKFIKEFIEVRTQQTKWSLMQKALQEHFLVKQSKEYAKLYVIKTVAQDLQMVSQKIEHFVEYLTKKSTLKKENLLRHIEEYILFIQKQIDQIPEFQEYSKLIVKSAKLKSQLHEAKSASRELRLKIEEIRFRLQKTDFQNNLDYVFPSGLVIGLQTKLKELQNMIQGLSSETSYLDPGDTDFVIPIEEQLGYTKFFATEDPDLSVTYQRMEAQLKMAMEIDEIEGLLDKELGEALARAQEVTPDKHCFQLAELSYFVFIMLKTNVVVNESRFFEGFFNGLQSGSVKEFIVFNYMIFTNEDFVDDLLSRYEQSQKQAMSDQNVLADLFVKDYVSNYTMMISFYRDMTEFGRAEDGVIQKSSMFAKNLLAMVLTLVQTKLEEFMEGNIEDLVDLVVGVIMTAIPFLALVPFGKSILSSTLTYIIQFIIQILSVFASGVASFFNRKYGEMMNNQLKTQLKSDFLFDYMKEIEKVRKIGVEKKQASFDSNANIKILEEKYLAIMNDEENVFNKLESLNVYRDVDYEKNLLDVYQNQTN